MRMLPSPDRLKGCTRRSLEPRQGRYRRARGASPEAGPRGKPQFFGPPRPPAPPRGRGGRPRMMRDGGNGLSRLTHSGLAPRAIRSRPFGASRTPFQSRFREAGFCPPFTRSSGMIKQRCLDRLPGSGWSTGPGHGVPGACRTAPRDRCARSIPRSRSSHSRPDNRGQQPWFT